MVVREARIEHADRDSLPRTAGRLPKPCTRAGRRGSIGDGRVEQAKANVRLDGLSTRNTRRALPPDKVAPPASRIVARVTRNSDESARLDAPIFNRIAPPASSALCSMAVLTLPSEPLPSRTGLGGSGAAGAAQSNVGCATAGTSWASNDRHPIVRITRMPSNRQRGCKA
jgi:hypothetical protein